MTATGTRNPLKPGFRIHWYEIKRVLGQGGFGITYLAYDTNLQMQVAIKEYLPADFAIRREDSSIRALSDKHEKHFDWGLRRFINEGQTLARFKHPNIVQVLSIFEANDTAYMIMAYEHGESLQALLARRKNLPQNELLAIILPILDGLEQVHTAGFIHRDIKPPNIYIREDGSPVLLDFGSARQALGQETQTVTAMVSPGFAPFEQYYSKSDKQGPWTDIYGLGATLYFAAVGKVPVPSVDRSHAYLESSSDLLSPAQTEGARDYSADFLRAIDHALQFRASDRPQTVLEWRRELTHQAPTVQSPRQRKGVTAIAAVVLAFAIGGSAWYWWHRPVGDAAKHETAVVAEATDMKREETAADAEKKKQAAQAAAAAEAEKQKQAAQARAAAEAEKQRQAEEAKRQAAALAARQAEMRHRQLTDLIQQANADLAAGRLASPDGANALTRFQDALKLDAANAEAQKGLRDVASQLAARARRAMGNHDFENAGRLLSAALTATPKDPALLDLRTSMAEQKKQYDEAQQKAQRISSLLDKAHADLKALRLTTPPGDNALENFKAVLAVDPGNKPAESGIHSVADRYVGLANKAIDDGSYDKANGYLDKAAAIEPDSANVKDGIKALQAARERAKQQLAAAQAAAQAPKPAISPTTPMPDTASTSAPALPPPAPSASASPKAEPATGPVATAEAAPTAKAPPQPPTLGTIKFVAVKVTGIDKDLERFGLTTKELISRMADALQQAGLTVIPDADAVKRPDAALLQLKAKTSLQVGSAMTYGMGLHLYLHDASSSDSTGFPGKPVWNSSNASGWNLVNVTVPKLKSDAINLTKEFIKANGG